MNILVTDGNAINPGDMDWSIYEKIACIKVYDSCESDDILISRINEFNADVLITNKVHITKEIIDACPCIKFIAQQATGYDNIDVKYAAEKGIAVSNVPTYGTANVAQFSIALLLELCHRIGYHSELCHQGVWSECDNFCFWKTPQIELDGKVLGIIGFGRIGQREGQIAKALGMKVLAYDIKPSESGKAIGDYVELNELLKKSDIISLHCNLTQDNIGMINKDSIAKMKDGVLIINDSRGMLVNEQDLADALNSGKVAGAAVDTVSSEPIAKDNPLLGAKNCIITPHMAWAAKESRVRIFNTTFDNIKAYMNGKIINCVNND